MTKQEAYRLLHPATTGDAIRELEYYGGLNGKAAAIEAIEEASLIACECIQKCMDEEDDGK